MIPWWAQQRAGPAPGCGQSSLQPGAGGCGSEVLLCRLCCVLSVPCPSSCRGLSLDPHQGRHSRCSRAFSIAHPVSSTSAALTWPAGYQKREQLRLLSDLSPSGCIHSEPLPRDAELAAFPPWWCFSFLSSCLSLFSPSSVIQFILSLTGFHFLYKYIAFSLASWL